MSKDSGYSDSKTDSQGSRLRELEAENKKLSETLTATEDRRDFLQKSLNNIIDEGFKLQEENKKLRKTLGMVDAVGMPEPYAKIVKEALETK